jgi:CRP/FNR family transcriptional regulator, cyclic AMP receptor protein
MENGRIEGPQHGPAWPAGSLLTLVPNQDRNDLLRLGRWVEFTADSKLIREGETSTDVFLLLSGVAKITADTIDGTVALIAIRAGGDLVGEFSSLDDRPRSATVTAAGSVIARKFTQQVFAGYLRTHPDVAAAVSASVIAKLRSSTKRWVDFGTYPVPVRLARALVELLSNYGRPTEQGTVIDLALTQPELASLIAASEPSVQRAVRELRTQNVITTGYRSLVVTDEVRLRAIAGQETV